MFHDELVVEIFGEGVAEMATNAQTAINRRKIMMLKFVLKRTVINYRINSSIQSIYKSIKRWWRIEPELNFNLLNVLLIRTKINFFYI